MPKIYLNIISFSPPSLITESQYNVICLNARNKKRRAFFTIIPFKDSNKVSYYSIISLFILGTLSLLNWSLIQLFDIDWIFRTYWILEKYRIIIDYSLAFIIFLYVGNGIAGWKFKEDIAWIETYTDVKRFDKEVHSLALKSFNYKDFCKQYSKLAISYI